MVVVRALRRRLGRGPGEAKYRSLIAPKDFSYMDKISYTARGRKRRGVEDVGESGKGKSSRVRSGEALDARAFGGGGWAGSRIRVRARGKSDRLGRRDLSRDGEGRGRGAIAVRARQHAPFFSRMWR